MLLIQLSGVVSFLAGAMAGPLAKRSEALHLVECIGNGITVYSEIVYCANDGNCNHNPSSNNQCITAGTPSGGKTVWEGTPQSCTFPTGVTFAWSIASNAASQPNFAVVGSGNNNFHAFTVHKDDRHVIFTDGHPYQCKSYYYAVPA